MTVDKLEQPELAERARRAAAESVRRKWPKTPRAGIILGTGLGRLSDHVCDPVVVSYQEIPGLPRATAMGHRGRLICGSLAGVPIVACDGRLHFYEGYSADEVTMSVAILGHLGAELLVVSNASGGLNPRFQSGDVMAIADHINLMGSRTRWLGNRGQVPSRSAKRSPALYDSDLIELSQEQARAAGVTCHTGTYVSVLGPNYETRAEYRALRRLGGDAVGMSTVPEVLAAVGAGMRILALSTITNVARPDVPTATAGDEVVDAAATAEPRLRAIISGVLRRLFPHEAQS